MPSGYRGGVGKLYYDGTWTDGSQYPPLAPDWQEIERAIDVSFAGTKGEADVSSRVSDWQLRLGALKDGTITFGYRMTQGTDDTYEFLVTAWMSDAARLFAVMSDDIATVGSKGWTMPGIVLNLNEEQPLTDGAQSNVTIAPTDARDDSDVQVEPDRLVVSA